MLALLLHIIAFWQEGIMDAMYESYKWDVSRQGPDFRDRDYDSYNPMSRGGFLSFGRDGWHDRKGYLWICIMLSPAAVALESWVLGINILWYCFLPALLFVARGIFFNASLNRARKKYRPDTETTA